MLSNVINDNQKDWDVHLPKAMFAYQTSLHESIGFSPFLVNYGCSAMLPIDVMFGIVASSSEGANKVPSYVEEVTLSFKTAYNNIRHSIEKPTKPTSLDTIKSLWV